MRHRNPSPREAIAAAEIIGADMVDHITQGNGLSGATMAQLRLIVATAEALSGETCERCGGSTLEIAPWPHSPGCHAFPGQRGSAALPLLAGTAVLLGLVAPLLSSAVTALRISAGL